MKLKRLGDCLSRGSTQHACGNTQQIFLPYREPFLDSSLLPACIGSRPDRIDLLLRILQLAAPIDYIHLPWKPHSCLAGSMPRGIGMCPCSIEICCPDVRGSKNDNPVIMHSKIVGILMTTVLLLLLFEFFKNLFCAFDLDILLFHESLCNYAHEFTLGASGGRYISCM